MLRRSDRILHYCIFIRSLRWILYNRNHTQLTRHNSYEPIHCKSYHWVSLCEKYWMKPTVRHKWLTKKKLWSLRDWNKRKLIIRENTKSIMKLLLRIQKIYKTSTRKRNEAPRCITRIDNTGLEGPRVFWARVPRPVHESSTQHRPKVFL